MDKHPPHQACPEGPHHHARRHRLSQHQRSPAAGLRPVRLHPPLQDLQGRADLLQRRAGRPGDRPREHRKPVCRHRVRKGQARNGRNDRLHQQHCQDRQGQNRPRRDRHHDQDDQRLGHRADRPLCVRLCPRQRPQQSHLRSQGEHPEVHRRPVPGSVAATWPRNIPTSSSKTASSTTCACSWCRSRSCTTCWCCRTCMATWSAIWRPAWSAAWAWRPEPTSAPRAPCSKPRTAARRNTRARTRSTRRP